MKYLASVFGLFLLALILALRLEAETRFTEIESKQATEIYFLKKEIEEQKKEIRLIRQDVNIIENGWELNEQAEQETRAEKIRKNN